MDADKLSQAEPPAAEPNAGDPPPPERRSVRRKLVQSTLLPHKPPEAETSGDLKGDKNSGGDEDAGDEECTGSQKKKPKRKAKAAPNPRSPKKKVKEKETTDGTPKRNSTPRKKTTPKKNLKTDVLDGSCSRKILNEDASPPPIPNLRLEAKITAEENSRMFAGKQLHPFFSSWKVGKKQKDVIDVENCPSTVKRDKKVTIGPIHVFDKNQDDDVCLDWRNWTFCEETSVSTSYDVEDKFISTGFQGLVKSLSLDRLAITSQPSCASYHQNKVCLNECIVQQEHLLETLPTVSALVADELTLDPLIKDTKVDLEAGSLPVDDGLVCTLNIEEQRLLEERAKSYYLCCGNHPEDSLWVDKYQPKKAVEVCGNTESVKLLSEWLHCWHQKDSLTSKDLTGRVKHNIQDNNFNYYQSDTDSENLDEEASLKNIILVTGPAGSGKSAAIYACAKEQGFKVLESNASQWRSGSVLKHEFEECLRSNMLNWSMKKSTDSRKNQNMKNSSALPNGIAGQHLDKEVVEVVSISDEETPQDVTGTSGEFFCKENGTACGQDGTKLLLLIEDVDVLLPEDRGFIASLQHIVDAAKGPIVLTSNNNSPLLPDKLDRLEVSFMMPSVKELFHYLYMICVAEKVEVQPQVIEQLIGCCHGDIRKTIMHLQFWCHGQVNGKGRGMLTPFCPLVFDLDAGHRMLPKIIPWGSPSKLSQLVQKEIDKTLAMLEANVTTTREGKVSSKETQNDLERHDNGTDNIEAKKQAMLNMNCYADDCNEIKTRYGVSCELPSSSGSPVAFSRRKIRRKLDVVMSSDSEEEFINDSVVMPPNKDSNQELFPEVVSGFPSHCPIMESCFKQLSDKQHDYEDEKTENLYQVSETADRTPIAPNKDTNWELFPDHDLSSHWLTMENCFNPLADVQHDSSVEKLENFDQISEIANGVHINNSSKSVDISCSHVPESSFVPETEMEESRAVSCFHVDASPAEVEVSSELVQNSSQVETESLDKAIPIFHTDLFMLEDDCTEVAESPREDAKDFETEQLEAVGKGYHLMDQCSRMDFNRCTRLVKKSKSSWVPNSVQESWEKLRSCHMDLRQHASEKEDACESLKLAYGMSNLISEADLLFSGSQLVMNGSLEPSDADFDAFGWKDELMQMTSLVAQRGFCVYAKDVAAVRSNINPETRMDTSETLASSHVATDFVMSPPRHDIASESKRKPLLFDAIQSMVPSKSYLALKGTAFHEYVSSLGSISRFETSRISDGTDQTRKRRRRRGALHYLTSGRLMLSDEEISMLARCSSYGKREIL